MMLAFVMALVMTFTFIPFADAANADSIEKVEQSVSSVIKTKEYEKASGGYYKGSELYTKGQNGYEINSSKVDELSKSAQSQLANDLLEAGNALSNPESKSYNKNVNKNTIRNWVRKLTNTKGMGTAMLTTLTSGVRPDFVSAQSIIAPFEGIIGTLIGVVSLFLFLFLGLLFACDVAYIGLPIFQVSVESASGGATGGTGTGVKGILGGLVSKDAKAAADEESSAKAMIVYLKKRFLFMFALAFVMFYLVMGQMNILIGSLLDLFSGFIGI